MVVEYVDADKIVIKYERSEDEDLVQSESANKTYKIQKNQSIYYHHLRPNVRKDTVKRTGSL